MSINLKLYNKLKIGRNENTLATIYWLVYIIIITYLNYNTPYMYFP